MSSATVSADSKRLSVIGYGHIDVNSCVRLARAMEKHQLAWMEEMVPWQLGGGTPSGPGTGCGASLNLA